MSFKVINTDYADLVVKLCCEAYNKLPKTGKPIVDEWTVVSGIVEDCCGIERVVALGTGSKCLGRNSLSTSGGVLHDAHAEVVARRGFLLYLYNKILSLWKTGSSDIFERKDNKVSLKENVRYIFVSSTVPCGDAAIIPMETTGELKRKFVDDDCNSAKKLRPNDDSTSAHGKSASKQSSDFSDCIDDVHRTGAKCLPDQEQDPKLPGTSYHVTGAVRTKPGRGDPTASVSCSDKLARWNAVGLQGALLSLLLESPIHFSAVIIGGGGPFSLESMDRAINVRIGEPSKVIILQSQISFSIIRSTSRCRPAPASIAWNATSQKAQICVEGRKLGATKSKPGQAALEISKVKLLQKFSQVVNEMDFKIGGKDDLSTFRYGELKMLAVQYKKTWENIVSNHLQSWTKKPLNTEYFTMHSGLQNTL